MRSAANGDSAARKPVSSISESERLASSFSISWKLVGVERHTRPVHDLSFGFNAGVRDCGGASESR